MNTYLMDRRRNTVHRDGCPGLPTFQNRLYLGNFTDSERAIEEGRKLSTQAKACTQCF